MINADGAEPATALLPVISHQQASTTDSHDGRGEAMRGEAGSRQPTTDKQLPGAAAIFARLSWLPGRRVRAAASPSLSPPEWLLIKNKHDFCFAFIFYYKPASPAPTRPALPCPALPSPTSLSPARPARKAMSCNLQSFCSLTPAFTACYVCDCLCMCLYMCANSEKLHFSAASFGFSVWRATNFCLPVLDEMLPPLLFLLLPFSLTPSSCGFYCTFYYTFSCAASFSVHFPLQCLLGLSTRCLRSVKL